MPNVPLSSYRLGDEYESERVSVACKVFHAGLCAVGFVCTLVEPAAEGWMSAIFLVFFMILVWQARRNYLRRQPR